MQNNGIITYKLTEKDYIDFNKYINFKILKYFIFPYIFIYLFFVMPEIINYKEGSFNIIRNYTLLFLIIFFICFFALNMSLTKKCKNEYKQNNSLKTEKKIMINSESIEIITKTSGSNILWEKITKIVYRKNFIYLMMSSLNGIIIPRNLLNDNINKILKEKRKIK